MTAKEKQQFKPMLAASVADESLLVYPLMASPKFDGVRAIIIDGVVMSRSLKPIPNAHVQKLFGQARFNGLDGELMVGSPVSPDAYRTTTSAVMSQDGEPEVLLYVFDDLTDPDDRFEDRLNSVKWRLSQTNTFGAVVVRHKVVNNLDELNKFEAEVLEAGYEGVMLRQKDFRYKFGRSTLKEAGLMKLKRFEDSEAEILGFVELQHNTNEATTNELGATARSHRKAGMIGKGCLGALQVRDVVTGVEFDIGTGFDQATREDMWSKRKTLKGALVKYKFFAGGVKDKPRFPVFLGLRDKNDTL